MKNIILIFLVNLWPLLGLGQTLDRWVVSSTGDYVETGSMSLSYTVGEVVVESEETPSLILTQGFQQSKLEGVGIEVPELDLSIKAYPNPTDGEVILEMESTTPLNLQLSIIDVQGRLISDRNIAVNGTHTQTIDLSDAAAGMYFLRLADDNGRLKTIRIEKLD